MNLKFKEYSSIENVERKKEINLIIQQGHSTGQWVVSEKIHGANFSFWITKDEIKCARRSGFLGEDSAFFNFQDVKSACEKSLRDIFDYVVSIDAGVECVTIYGELFGGNYQHPDVERTYMAMSVQKGVYYNPGNKFMAFDMVLRGETSNRVMNDTFVHTTCDMFGLAHVPILFKGTFEECLQYPNEFQTRVPEFYGLPAIENNIAEGVVIKPVEPKFFWNGSRVILKNKNEKWSERAKKQKSCSDSNKENKFDFELTVEASKLLEDVLTYVTENRLRNVLSKMEAITDRMFGMIVGNMNRDVMADFLKDNKDAFMVLEDKERKMITKRMGNSVMTLVRDNFVNILDNDF